MKSTTTESLDTARWPGGVTIVGERTRADAAVLTPDALRFVAHLEREFGDRRRELMKARSARQIEINAGRMPDFLSSTKHIRESYWRVAPVPADLLDRRVEITGPTDSKIIINGLNSGANVFMADFEDSNSPTWHNMVTGQKNLCDAVDRTLTYTNPAGRIYRLNEKSATLMVRPRGLHLEEHRVLVDGRPVSAAFFDFGIFVYLNARKLLDAGTGPYVYLAKLEGHQEAAMWNDIFLMTQDELEIPRGSIRATVLIETILAAFEMHEIMYELREHCAGLNCGRWDYIFSWIKKFRHHSEYLLPDRSRLTMMTHFLRSYSMLLIQTCHKRGAHAIGGMAAQIPDRHDPNVNDDAFAKVRADKEREVEDGHDGTWVAHPDLVPLARRVFDEKMSGPNQLHRKREDLHIEAADLLSIPMGDISEQGMRTNARVSLQYLASWLGGKGCVPIDHLMEDLATAEICRAQLWQWGHHGSTRYLDQRRLNMDMVRNLLSEEYDRIVTAPHPDRKWNHRVEIAFGVLHHVLSNRVFTEFLPNNAQEYIEEPAAGTDTDAFEGTN